MRHRHRRGQRQVRPARDQPRRDAGLRRHAAPAALHQQGEGDGPVPDRAHDGRSGSRARRPGVAPGAARQADGGGAGSGREDRQLLAAGGDDDQGVDQPRLRDQPGRRHAVRAARVPVAVLARGPERGHGGVRGEAQARVQEPVIEFPAGGGDMDRIWLKSYPAGVPADIKFDEFKSVGDLVDRKVVEFRERPAFYCMGKSITFGELDAQSRAFGAWLQSKGCKKGARVALMMPNCLQYPVALYGTLRAGCIVVNVNPLYTPRELEHQLKDSGAEVIVILENFANTLEQVLPRTPVKHVILAALGDMLGLKGALVNFVVRKVKKMVPAYSLPGALRFNDVLAEAAGRGLKPVDVGPDDIAFLQYTGGTTGVSKGAMLLHRNILANIEQAAAWLTPGLAGEDAIIITALPLYHIFSLTVNCLNMMKVGGLNVLITNPRDIPAFVKELGKHPYNVITGVNTLFNAFLNNPEFHKLDFSKLRLCVGGGMAVQKAVADRWQQVTGRALLEGYGLTETSPCATMNPLDLKDYNGSIGLPMSSTDVVLRDDSGREVPIGQPGEICIRGPQVMKGYWQRPDETAKVLGQDGFLLTGDIGIMDEKGFIRIVDRKKDMILVSGFNVYPNEIEQVVATLPGVLECAVIGVPDEHSSEVPKVYVVRKDPQLTEQDVLEHCRKELTGYKRPKYVEFRTELPKTNGGKILRRALREEKKAARALPGRRQQDSLNAGRLELGAVGDRGDVLAAGPGLGISAVMRRERVARLASGVDEKRLLRVRKIVDRAVAGGVAAGVGRAFVAEIAAPDVDRVRVARARHAYLEEPRQQRIARERAVALLREVRAAPLPGLRVLAEAAAQVAQRPVERLG